MKMKRNVVVCSLLVAGTYVYGMDHWQQMQEKSFTQWTAKHLEESNKHFLEVLETELSNEERAMICLHTNLITLHRIRMEELYKPVERQKDQKKAEKK